MTSRNRPHIPDDPLLAQAVESMMNPSNTFVVKPWREIMAEKKSPTGRTVSKTPNLQSLPINSPEAAAVKKAFRPNPADPFGLLAKSKPVEPTSGSCAQDEPVVQLNSGPISALSKTLMKETTMTEPTKQELAEAAAKAKIAAKAEKIEAAKKAAEAKAQAAADKKAAAEKAKAEKAEKLEADRKAKAEQKAADKEARATTPVTDDGSSMLALRDKVNLGLYVKGKNGQLRSGDEIALTLETVAVADMVPLLLKTLGMNENPYAHLNQGQQSMNLRNKLRGAIRKEAKIKDTETVINLDRLKEVRAEFGVVEPKAPKADKPAEATEGEAAAA